jgi:hypothetical protein
MITLDEKIVNKHPKCGLILVGNPFDGYDYDCEYDTSLECEECKYGLGKKDPEAKCNSNS